MGALYGKIGKKAGLGCFFVDSDAISGDNARLRIFGSYVVADS